MKTNRSLREVSIESARESVRIFNMTMAPNLPIRFRLVIVHGPTTGFVVCELGFALSEGLSVIR
jgi:hypothetical protein